MAYSEKSKNIFKVISKAIPIVFMVVLTTLAIIYRNSISFEAIVNYSPDNPILAVLFLWLLCLGVFVVGQFLAPPDYNLLPGNFWGGLFGFTFVFGSISFCLTVLFMILSFSKDKNNFLNQEYRIINFLSLFFSVSNFFSC